MVAIQSDFNTYDAFKIFDMRGLGYIDEFDLKTGLSESGIYASYDDLKLFFKAYDSNKDGKVRYSEFCDAIVP
jgi:Ca2+-binding EF-hand superfamily protein